MLNDFFKKPGLLYGSTPTLTISITLIEMAIIMIEIYNYNNNQSTVLSFTTTISLK